MLTNRGDLAGWRQMVNRKRASLSSLLAIINNIVEGISFVLVLFEERLEDIIALLTDTRINKLMYRYRKKFNVFVEKVYVPINAEAKCVHFLFQEYCIKFTQQRFSSSRESQDIRYEECQHVPVIPHVASNACLPSGLPARRHTCEVVISLVKGML
jgi:hypothetical protein